MVTWIPHMRGSLKGKDKGGSPASASNTPSSASATAAPSTQQQQQQQQPSRAAAAPQQQQQQQASASSSSSSSAYPSVVLPVKLQLDRASVSASAAAAASSIPTMSPAPSPDSRDSLEIPQLERIASIPYQAGADDDLHDLSGPPAYYATEGTSSVKPNPKTRQVWVHLYHTDPYTAWLNWAGLKYAEVPIYHAGIEVYGIEWAFQYFDDAWDDDTVSGVVCCEPKSMGGFDYQESHCLGPTSLSAAEVRSLIGKLRPEWPANTYHLCRHNCLTFARHLVEQLDVPEPFPAMLHGFGDAPRHIPVTDAIVDWGWSWYKWGMQRSAAAQREEDDDEVTEADDDFISQQAGHRRRSLDRPPFGATASASQGSNARFIN